MARKIKHTHLESVPSTNDYVKEHYSEFDLDELCIVSATMQTNGRGTKGASWHSSTPHNIYATFFFETTSTKDLQCLAQLLSLSCAKVIESFGLSPTIKWPNDLLLQHKKIGGILCEILSQEESSLVILGIGLNVNMPSSVLDEIDQPATSLFVATGKVFSSQDLLKKIAEEFLKDLEVFLESGFSSFCEMYNAFMVYRDLPVFEKDVPLGFSQRVTENGFLECRGKKGDISYISSGSIQIRS